MTQTKPNRSSPETEMRSAGKRWRRRFGDAISGVVIACKTQESLWVHSFFAVAVPAFAAMLRVERWQWCVLILCITVVISLEIMNSAIERLVKTLHPEHDAGLAETLHMAAGAVLIAALGAVTIGLCVLLPEFYDWLASFR